jgi:peptidoglycan/LPS O-acetylase OafA/YrhL
MDFGSLPLLSVLAFHLSPRLVSGGFVGVDVFFVIFWIPDKPDDRLRDPCRYAFRLSDFYDRRIRRIFQALFPMLIALCAAAWRLFLPPEFVAFAPLIQNPLLHCRRRWDSLHRDRLMPALAMQCRGDLR